MGRHLRHAILLAAVLAPAIVFGQTAKTWTSATGEFADFATGANWSGGTAPTSNTTTNYALFTSASYANNQAALAASRSIAGVEWSAASGGGALSYTPGATLTLGAYGLRTSALGTVDIDVPLALGTSTSFLDNGSSFWISSSVALGANTLTLGGNGANEYGYSRLTGLISGTGGLTVNYTGPYGWILSANNTYTGTTTLTAGTVIADSGSFGTGTLVFNGGSLSANSAASFNNALTLANQVNFSTPSASSSLTFNGAATLTGSRTINVIGNGAAIFNGAVGQSSAGYGLTKGGTGALVLNAASTYTGATTITGGSLNLGTNGTISNANLILNGGTLGTKGTWSRALGTGAGQFQFGGSGGGFAAYGGPLTVTISNGSPTWYTLFGGQYALFGSTVADNVVTFTNSLDLISSTDHYFTVADNPATTADHVRYTGALSGPGYFNKQGAGTLVLAGANTNTGDFRVLGGTLRAESATAFGTGAITVQGSTVELGLDADTEFGNALQLNSGTSTFTSDRLTPGAGVIYQFGNVNASGTIIVNKGANVTSGTAGIALGTVNGASTFNVAAGALLEMDAVTGSGSISFNGAGDAEVLGALSNLANALNKSNTGTLTLGGASTRTGLTNLTGGTLVVGADTALGTGALGATSGTLRGTGGARTLAVPFNVNGSITLGGTSDLTFTGTVANSALNTLTVSNTGKTTLAGPVVLSNSSANRILTINNSGEVLISGAIANGSTSTSGIVKAGAGLLTLSGANTFTGVTTVNAGTLNLTGSLQSPTLIIADGASLTGGGLLKDLSLAGVYSPGNSPALVSLDNLTMVSTAVLNMEIGGTTRGTQYDALAITNALTAGGTLNVSFINGFTPSGSTTFDLFDFSSASGSFATVNVTGLDWHWTWDTASLLTTGELTLNFTAVPEPSTYALLATGLGLAVLARRRRR